MNPEADARHRLTELRLRMIRSKLDHKGHEQSDLGVSSNGMYSNFAEYSNDQSAIEPTSELEILLEEKLERLRMLNAKNQVLRTQLSEAGERRLSVCYSS